MASHLLAPKFYQPVPSDTQVRRNHLTRQLAEGLASGHPLTLISAPAGYGKTSLAAEWCQQLEKPIAWLSLDETDDEPLRFFLYFVAAIQKVDASIGQELMAMFTANQLPSRETLVTWLINDLECTKAGLVCVLDDFQAIQDTFITAVLQDIITHPPHLFHLVILTREDPPFPLGRLRAHNQLTEIRAADLRFSRDEERRFFQDVLQIRLSDSDLVLLDERTEGWAAGLQLVGLSIQGQEQPSAVIGAMSGSHQFVLSYLTEEVLKRQSRQVHDFLLQTSILPKFTAALCNAVTNEAESDVLIERLVASNLFIVPLDSEGQWYRYHHLFAELLVSRLKRVLPERVKNLHQRASRWYEDQNMPLDAIDQAISAGDFAYASALLEKHTWELLNQGFVRRVEAWMDRLPSEWRASSPRASLGFAWMYLLRGNLGRVQPYLQQAGAALEQDAGKEHLQAEYLALKANLLQTQGRIPESIEAANKALALADPSNSRVLGLAYLGLGAGYRQAADFERAIEALQQAIQAGRASGDSVTGTLATTHLVLMCLQHGRLRLAEEFSARAIEWMEHSNTAPPPIIGAVYGALGLVYYEYNQVEQARDCYRRGIQLGSLLGHNASLIYTLLNLAQLLQAEGDLENAAKTLRQAQNLLLAGAPGWLRPSLVVHQVKYHLLTRNFAEAESVLRQCGVNAGGTLEHATDEIQLAYVRVMLERGTAADLEAGITLAAGILALAESSRRNTISMQALILGALIHEKLGASRSAEQWLECALALAEPEGYIRMFTDEGAPLAAILGRLPKTNYVRDLLAAFPAPERQEKAHPASSLVEPLSERELDVLRLLAQGLKYAEIAEKLVVSVNTVRFHVKGIYGKLGVEKQVQAVERGRTLGLI